jgi:predicted DNA-binding transcriptional regulator AlpA
MLSLVPKLNDLLADPGKAAHVPVEVIPALLGELEQIKALLWSRLTVPQNGRGESSSSGDRLLDIQQAALKLGMSKDCLYRNADHLPFTVRIGKKQLRFSEAGIDRYIKNRLGR